MARTYCLGLRQRLGAIAAAQHLDLRDPADRQTALEDLGTELRRSCSTSNLRRAARLPKHATWHRATSALLDRAMRICTGGQRL